MRRPRRCRCGATWVSHTAAYAPGLQARLADRRALADLPCVGAELARGFAENC